MRFITKILHAALLNLVVFTVAEAQTVPIPGTYYTSTMSYLQQIANNTYNTLVAVNNIPAYLNTVTQMALSWLAVETDSSSFIPQTQQSFASLGYWSTQDITTQNAMQQQLVADMLRVPVSDFTNPADKPEILNLFPTVNDIAYATVLGIPPAPKGSSSAYNYIKNASGVNIYHVMPGLNWTGTKTDKDKYSAYYNTITSVTSYNGYILSQLAAENQNGNQLSALQSQLINQASNSTWLAQMSTEDLGKVLRDILLFQSQSYVLLTQLVQTEKQILAAHAMTNSLLLLYGQMNESQLVSKAQGVQPRV